ncbi:MAG: hypothetical protein ACXW27_16005 [Allosphingosinicella sp.]
MPLLALLAAGCYPLEQAPLVYTSRQQMGVNVSAGTPDNPGLELSIGYKGVDAALVPVMVAKHCPEVSAEQCDKLTYHLEKILGKNNVGDESSVDSARINELQGAVRVHQAEVTRLEDDLKEVKSNIADVDRSQSELQAFESERQTIVDSQNRERTEGEEAPVEDRTVRLQEIDNQIGTLKAKVAARSELEATRLRTETEIANAKSRLTEDRNRLKELQERRAQSSKDDKEDALSVFGSFDGNASANNNSASLGVGKVFSTGVASQHLTQGLGRASSVAVRAKCILTVSEVAKTLPDEPKAKLLAQIGEICMENGGAH